jgi:hypothetical protein
MRAHAKIDTDRSERLDKRFLPGRPKISTLSLTDDVEMAGYKDDQVSVFKASPGNGREDKAPPDVYWEASEFAP